LTPPPSIDEESYYGQHDAVVQRFNVKKRKLRAKGNQSFSDFCIAGVKKRLLKLQVLKLHTGATWPLKFNIKMQSSLDWFGTFTKPEAHASEKKTNEKKPTKRQMKSYTTGAKRY